MALGIYLGRHFSYSHIMTSPTTDPFNLERFKSAQDVCYHRVKAELAAGKKRSHWMWFIFPQINGLGQSPMDAEYSIKSKEEAQAYLQDSLLSGRLKECIHLLLDTESDDPALVMGSPDDVKLRSSMTLFAAIADNPALYREVLSKFYGGETDRLTLSLLVYPV